MPKVDNALILAAGRGSRLKELTISTPKPLLKIGETNFIEEIIRKIKKAGIEKIYVVVGYLADQFEYLTKKYNLNIINNKNWNKGNNVTSLIAAKEILKNTLIINGDVVINGDIIKDNFETSVTYVEENKNLAEWIVKTDENNNVVSFDVDGIDKEGYYQREITFVTEDLSKEMINLMDGFDIDQYQEFLVLEASKKSKIPLKFFKINKGLIFDLDNKEEYINYLKGEKNEYIN